MGAWYDVLYSLGGGAEGIHLFDVVIRRTARELLRCQYGFDMLVVPHELVVGDRPAFVASVREVLLREPIRILAEQHVRVDQRSSTDTARAQRAAMAEEPHVVDAIQAGARVP